VERLIWIFSFKGACIRRLFHPLPTVRQFSVTRAGSVADLKVVWAAHATPRMSSGGPHIVLFGVNRLAI
jgi:hypothetical protein